MVLYSRSSTPLFRLPGSLPLRPMLAALGRSGYAELITLELSPIAVHGWSRSQTLRILRQAYDSPDQVEFYVGLFAEDPTPNTPTPPLIRTMVAAKSDPLNKAIITDITRNNKSSFLTTNFIL